MGMPPTPPLSTATATATGTGGGSESNAISQRFQRMGILYRSALRDEDLLTFFVSCTPILDHNPTHLKLKRKESKSQGTIHPNMHDVAVKRDKDEGDDSIIRCVFASSDLVFNILRPLIDGDPCTTIGLLQLATVSKSFQNTVQSNQFWCDICYQRWKTKWGFWMRWNKALSDYNNSYCANWAHKMQVGDA
jgi:hypothetical protein